MRCEKVEIGKVSKVISGFAFKSKDFQSIGTPVIKIKNIKDENIVLNESDCVDSAIEVPLRFHLSKGDILISLTGSHITLPSSVVGRVAKYRHETNSYLNQRAGKFINIDDEKCVKDYLFYFLLQKETLTKIANKAQGAANQANISPGDVEGVEINLPPLPTQRKIASILSAYDDLIENNLKRIKLLEEKAFLRYKGIVREEKMVSENKLEEIIQTVKRKPKVLKSDYKEKGEFPIIDQSTDFIGGYTNEKESVYEDTPIIVFGDHTRILKYINFPFACGADGTQLVKPENPNISIAYLYFELISCNLSNYHYARHFKFLKEQIIKLPSEKVMLEFKEETENIFNLIQLLRLQNTKLREARDILLPKLMNGQIEV
ncbi:HsdS Restriction endonuclease S subunits [Spirosomataceae bacterium]|jgi:type I restriction enzyme S subunit